MFKNRQEENIVGLSIQGLLSDGMTVCVTELGSNNQKTEEKKGSFSSSKIFQCQQKKPRQLRCGKQRKR